MNMDELIDTLHEAVERYELADAATGIMAERLEQLDRDHKLATQKKDEAVNTFVELTSGETKPDAITKARQDMENAAQRVKETFTVYENFRTETEKALEDQLQAVEDMFIAQTRLVQSGGPVIITSEQLDSIHANHDGLI